MQWHTRPHENNGGITNHKVVGNDAILLIILDRDPSV